MLALPDNGMARSIDEHNIRLDILCDWIEGSILFDENEDEFSVMDVVDVLIDENIYQEQEFARNIVNDAWNEMERRLHWVGQDTPFLFRHSRVKRTSSWQDTPAHSFCVLVSLSQCYRGWWAGVSGSDYNEQGELFELLTQESLEKQFSDWEVQSTGWSRTQPTRLYEVVDRVANCLGEATRNDIDSWISSGDKEAGLDLLCYRPFPDNRAGFPVYLMQCASGQNWMEKLYEPDINVWQKLIEFVVRPQKAFAIPFALSENDFRKQCVVIQGLFLDRYRLLTAARYHRQWVSSSLKDRIIKWAMPRVNQLPRN